MCKGIEELFEDRPQSGDRVRKETPTIPSLHSPKVDAKRGEVQQKRDEKPSHPTGGYAMKKAVDPRQRRHTKKQARQGKSKEQERIKPQGEVARAKMEEISDKIRCIGEKEQPQKRDHRRKEAGGWACREA